MKTLLKFSLPALFFAILFFGLSPRLAFAAQQNCAPYTLCGPDQKCEDITLPALFSPPAGFPLSITASGSYCLDSSMVLSGCGASAVAVGVSCSNRSDADGPASVPPVPPAPGSGNYDFSYTGLKFNDLQSVLAPIVKIVYYAALVVGVVFIIYSGYVIMTSEGNPQIMQQGQEQLTAAILGILFILLSAAILRVIINSIILGA
jgi:hypothetical protein